MMIIIIIIIIIIINRSIVRLFLSLSLPHPNGSLDVQL